MKLAKVLLVLALFNSAFLLGCKDKHPTAPDYGDSSLVVEGTEVWQRLNLNWRSEFDKRDADADGMLDVAEFTSKYKRENLAQRGIEAFGVLDVDQDELLSYDEYRNRGGEFLIINLDADGSETVSVDEYGSHRPFLVPNGRLADYFATIDLDGSGELTASELEMEPFEKEFYETDRDGDQYVTEAELFVRASNPSQQNNAMRKVKRRDLNRDGRLSLREFLYDRSDAKFWAMDANDDMTVSLEEFSESRYAVHVNDVSGMFRLLDLNPDGQLGIGEFRKREEATFALFGSTADKWMYDDALLFARLDLDGSGSVSIEEVYPEGVDGSVSEQFHTQFEDMDADESASVDLAEFTESEFFLRYPALDADRDGVLSPDEFFETVPRLFSRSRYDDFFDAADLNSDGVVDVTEHQSHSSLYKFYDRDADEDDVVSFEEFARTWFKYTEDGRVGPAFQSHDVDGDGAINAVEFQRNPPMMRFLELDADPNGRLTVEEYASKVVDESFVATKHADFAQNDVNNDGSLSVREYFTEPRFAPLWEMDVDQNGKVSLNEFSGSRRFRHADNIAGLFREMDRNRNGECEFNEYESRSNSVMFTELDVNKDSALSPQEFLAIGFTWPESAGKIFNDADHDSDQQLNRQEFEDRETNPSNIPDENEGGI